MKTGQIMLWIVILPYINRCIQYGLGSNFGQTQTKLIHGHPNSSPYKTIL